MRVIVFMKANKQSEAGVMPSEKLISEMMKFNEELVKAGVLLGAEGLHPSSKGVRVRFADGKTTVVDGPFAETKELVAGFWLWQVKSVDEAVAWVKRIPADRTGSVSEAEVEIRPIYEAEDFSADVFTPELMEQEKHLRAEVDKRQRA
jgi:hypothetical protein